ncbi:uncharacterized protein LOC121905477 [Thunnus maccoyii]|uniref:uncharacterized protein LOC121905477 n=1 Tax=Thunnus maccoyii TaxID=8240 RepID=UPI001C4B5EF5|nr:uncharacterized protein LOC121905477 [Thunnus maccoyii]
MNIILSNSEIFWVRKRLPLHLDGELTDEDLRRAEDLIILRVLCTSTLCFSTKKNPACSQILPILQELEMHFAVEEGDSVFVSNLKKKVWVNLSKLYQSTEHDCGEDGSVTMQSEKSHENEEGVEREEEENLSI